MMTNQWNLGVRDFPTNPNGWIYDVKNSSCPLNVATIHWKNGDHPQMAWNKPDCRWFCSHIPSISHVFSYRCYKSLILRCNLKKSGLSQDDFTASHGNVGLYILGIPSGLKPTGGTVDGWEIPVENGGLPPVSIGFQASKVMQTFATIHSIFRNIQYD